MTIDPAAILDFAAQASAGVAELAPEPLSEQERSTLGGGLFVGGTAFVRGVAQALDSGRFAGAGDGDELRAGQARAAAWLHLSELLGDLKSLCRDAYLREQGDVTRRALTTVAQLRHDAAAPSATEALCAPGTPSPGRRSRWCRPSTSCAGGRRARAGAPGRAPPPGCLPCAPRARRLADRRGRPRRAPRGRDRPGAPDGPGRGEREAPASSTTSTPCWPCGLDGEAEEQPAARKRPRKRPR